MGHHSKSQQTKTTENMDLSNLRDRAAQLKHIEETIARHSESIAYHGQSIAYHDKSIVYHHQSIKHNEECVRLLQEEINKLEPVSSLPPEILGTVFAFVLDEYIQASVHSPFPLYYFTDVSRSWRYVALNTPCLWRLILPFRERWTIAALKRSKGADLILLSRFSGHRSICSPRVSFLKQVLTEHASHIREIDTNLNSSTRAAFEDLPQSSLRLNSLKFISDKPWGSYLTFPTGIVETSSLQRLEIRNCNGPWYSMSFPALTTLKLHQIKNRTPLVEFLGLLRGLTTLQVLDMQDSLPYSRDTDPAIGLIDSPIHLPNLRFLFLVSTQNQNQVSNILSRITVPPTAALRIVVNIGSAKMLASSFSVFLSHMNKSISYCTLHILSPASSSSCPLSLRSVSGCGTVCDLPTTSGHIHLRAWNGDDGSVASNLEVVVALHEPLMPIDSQKVVRRIFPSLPLSDIAALTLEISPVGLLLRHFISNLPRLQNVTVIGNCAGQFIKELTRRRKDHDCFLHSGVFTEGQPRA